MLGSHFGRSLRHLVQRTAADAQSGQPQ